jgi:N-terminal domain on NACHT_NTPase and P-loop NTPases
MSGAEAGLVIGLITSVITIVQATKKVYDAANDATSLPPAFCEVAKTLPLVDATLRLAEKSVDDTTCTVIKPVIETCKDKARQLNELFEKVVPKPDATRIDRYRAALRALGKGSLVENLMKGIPEKLQLLAYRDIFAEEAKLAELTAAIEELSKVPSSAPDFVFDSPPSTTIDQHGTGNQYIHSGLGDQQINNITGSGTHYIGTTQNFGSTGTK